MAVRQLKRGRNVSIKKAADSERVQEDPAIQLLTNNSSEGEALYLIVNINCQL